MLNTLRVDFKRYVMSKMFMIFAVIVAIVEPLASAVLINAVGKAIKREIYVTINDFAGYASLASIILAVTITMFLHAEAGEGIIRNKLISGKKRYQVILSYCIVNSVMSVALQVVNVITVAVVAFGTGAGFENSVEEIMGFIAIAILAEIAVSILYTVAYLCFCTQRVAIAVPGAIAIFMKLASVVILDALYPGSGVPKVTGMTLKIYEGIDRYVPFFHLTPPVRFDSASYVIGNIAVIVVSLLIGIFVFSRKDLK